MLKNSVSQKILIVGGAGYIGTHVVSDMLTNQHTVCVIDDFSNSKEEGLRNIEKAFGISFGTHRLDACDYSCLKKVFKDFEPDLVIHLAGLKSIEESAVKPLEYYEKNIFSLINVLKAMHDCGCNKILFSSSASVYENQNYPLDESEPVNPISSYARSKYFLEEILKDWVTTGLEKSALIFRYFNPAGGNKFIGIGDDPKKQSTNLFPLINLAILDPLFKLKVYGSDYDTRDGTPVRDYVHVRDIARAHSLAISFGFEQTGFKLFNLGSNTGYSVLEIINAFEKVTGKRVPHEFVGRRSGDVASSVADSNKAKQLLNWSPQFGIEAMCEDEWGWRKIY